LKRDDGIDFFYVEADQLAIHDRLENWARYVDAKGVRWEQAPIWKLGKSASRQWDVPELRPPVNTLDGHAIEKAVSALPIKHREAMRWYYVWKGGARHACINLAVTRQGLVDLVKAARHMLINRMA
jgi:hypothetical protein